MSDAGKQETHDGKQEIYEAFHCAYQAGVKTATAKHIRSLHARGLPASEIAKVLHMPEVEILQFIPN